jgi:hypothetical protein
MPIAIHLPVNGLVHGQVPYESNPVMEEKESTTTSDHLPSRNYIYMSFNDSSNIRFNNSLLASPVYQLI